MQEALGLGVIGIFVGKFAATLWALVFPKHIVLETGDAVRAFVMTLAICARRRAGDSCRARRRPRGSDRRVTPWPPPPNPPSSSKA